MQQPFSCGAECRILHRCFKLFLLVMTLALWWYQLEAAWASQLPASAAVRGQAAAWVVSGVRAQCHLAESSGNEMSPSPAARVKPVQTVASARLEILKKWPVLRNMGKGRTKLSFTEWKRLRCFHSSEERELLEVDLFSAAAFQLNSFLWRLPARSSPAD